MKAKQQLTDTQRKRAFELSEQLFKKGVGQQPAFVLYDDGEVFQTYPNAVCLGWLFNTWDKRMDTKRNPVLFQMVVDNTRCKMHGGEKVHHVFTPKFVSRYLNWAVNSQLLSPFICHHTAEERKNFIPIALVDVPQNAPLLTSTHIRIPWDRHNNSRNINIAILRERFPKWSWSMVVAVAHCFTNLNNDTVNIGTYDGGHDPFGHASYERFAAYANRKWDKAWYPDTKFNHNHPDRGSISAMFSGYRKTMLFKDVIRSRINELTIKPAARYGQIYSNADAWRMVTECYKLLKGYKHA